MKKFIHSYYSRPYLSENNRWKKEKEHITSLWLFSLSMEYVRRNNHEIVLFTDNFGAEIFADLGYDKIYNDLNCLEKMNLHERFWAAGKIIALQNSPVGDVHIDGDVFLKNEQLCRDILNKDCDLIAQNAESAFINGVDTHYCFIYSALEKIVPDLQKFITKERYGLNCGVVGFQNAELKDKFCSGYFENMVKIHAHDLKTMSEISTPDLICEQLFLMQCARESNAKVELLLDSEWSEYGQQIADKIGYCHLIGNSKYTYLPEVKNILQKINPELYEKVLERANKLEN